MVHCLTARGRWAVELLQCTASRPGGSRQWNPCNALPHCPGGRGQWNSDIALSHRLAAVGSAPATHCCTAWGQWAAQLLQRTASLAWASGQWESCNAPSQCLGPVGSRTPAMHCLTAWGQRAVQLPQHTASLPGGQWAVDYLRHTTPRPGGGGQCDSRNALPHCLGAVGFGTRATHSITAWGQWALGLVQRSASLPGGSGQCHPCNALPRYLGAVSSWMPAMHCRTA